jgi:hypothetical protein
VSHPDSAYGPKPLWICHSRTWGIHQCSHQGAWTYHSSDYVLQCGSLHPNKRSYKSAPPVNSKEVKTYFPNMLSTRFIQKSKDGRVARSWPNFYQFDNKIAVCRSISLNWKHVTQNIIHCMTKVKRKRSNVPEQQTTLPGSIL